MCKSRNHEYVYNYSSGEKEYIYNYEKYNTGSLHFLFKSMSTYNGPLRQDLAIDVLKEFIEWYTVNKPDNYFPVNGMYQMYSIYCLHPRKFKMEQNYNISN